MLAHKSTVSILVRYPVLILVLFCAGLVKAQTPAAVAEQTKVEAVQATAPVAQVAPVAQASVEPAATNSAIVCSNRGCPPNCIPNPRSLAFTISFFAWVCPPRISLRLPETSLAIVATSYSETYMS